MMIVAVVVVAVVCWKVVYTERKNHVFGPTAIHGFWQPGASHWIFVLVCREILWEEQVLSVLVLVLLLCRSLPFLRPPFGTTSPIFPIHNPMHSSF